LVHISKRVITQLETSDWFDRILLLFGLVLFCSVVLYIIKKRTWDVGISWVSWLSQTKNSKKVIMDAAAAVTTKTVLLEPSTLIIDTSFSSAAITAATATATAATEATAVITSWPLTTTIANVIKDEL
jgi:protein transport protein SEC20